MYNFIESSFGFILEDQGTPNICGIGGGGRKSCRLAFRNSIIAKMGDGRRGELYNIKRVGERVYTPSIWSGYIF